MPHCFRCDRILKTRYYLIRTITIGVKMEKFSLKDRFFTNRTPTQSQNRNTQSNSISKRKKLVAFDFDHTVVDANTDLVVRDLVAKEKISDEVAKLYKNSGWIPYMQEIFNILHANGITKSRIKSTIESIPEVAGVKALIKQLHATNTVDIIIISDSNSEFIRYWCDYNGIGDYVKRIYTNKAQFSEDGILRIEPYHHQLACALSSENLCKGDVLEEFIRHEQHENDVIYEKVFYVGDGSNDICPILRLSDADVGFARKDYRMLKEIDAVLNGERIRSTKFNMDAKLMVWSDGYELKELIFEYV